VKKTLRKREYHSKNMKSTIKYKTSSPAGDLISFLAGIKKVWEDTGQKAVIYQRLDVHGGSYDGAIHPFANEEGEPVCMPMQMFDMLRPLLLHQEYVEDYLVYDGGEINVDFDLIRMERYTNQPRGSLNRWYNYVFPQMATDLSKPWLKAPKSGLKNVILNFTQRHRNSFVTYYFLRDYQDKLVFVGLEKEHKLFCKAWNLDFPRLEVKDFLQLATVVQASQFFLGNQSFCFQLAEAMKVPRILEIFPIMPNVIPVGEHAYDYYHQGGVEYYFKKLNEL